MADIRDIAITSTQTVQQPKPHTTYTIQITTPTRTWTVSRRYNDFLALQAELASSTGKEPPAPLPGKHMWRLTRAVFDEKVVRERRVLLEAYLRCILTTKDARWRQAYGFLDFLAVPPQARASGSGSGPSSGSGGGQSSSVAGAAGSDGFPPPPDHWTPQAWLAEQTVLSGMLRSVRSALLKRDALASMSDAAGSRSASVEAKRLLRDAESRIAGLERALGAAVGGLGEGEKRRREEMCENLKAERGNLQRMAEAGVRTSAAASAMTGHMPGGSGSLFAPAGSGPSFGGSGGTSPTVGRVFGVRQPPQETAETRPLDDRGLLQLQTSKMSDQDAQLGELSKVLRRQKDMGELIHREIEEQNDLLDEVESGVDRTGRKLGKAKREMNKLSK